MPGASVSRMRAGLRAARRALLVDGLEVEQVGGLLRAAARPARAGRRGLSVGGVDAVHGDRARRGAARSPAAPTAATTCPSRCGPSARSPGRAAASSDTSRTATVRPCTTVRPRRRPRRRPPPAAARPRAAAGSVRARRPGAARRARSAAAATSRRPGPAPPAGVRRARWPAPRPAPRPPATPSPVTRQIRSANGTTRSSRCSASSTETPRSCTSRVSVASTSSAAVGSSAEVGSSSTSSRGCMVSTEPIATRCCCPPDRVRRSRARRSAMPSRSRVSSTRRRIVSGGSPSCSMP